MPLQPTKHIRPKKKEQTKKKDILPSSFCLFSGVYVVAFSYVDKAVYFKPASFAVTVVSVAWFIFSRLQEKKTGKLCSIYSTVDFCRRFIRLI